MCNAMLSLLFWLLLIPQPDLFWIFEELNSSTVCPSIYGGPRFDRNYYLGAVRGGPAVIGQRHITMGWEACTPNTVCILLMQYGDINRPLLWPCILVNNDVALTSVANSSGKVVFSWFLPQRAGLGLVPYGRTNVGYGQVISINNTSIETSYLFSIDTIR